MTPVLVERIKEVLRALVLCCISIYWLCKAKEPSEGHTGAAPGGWMNPGPWGTGGCDPTPWAWIAPIPPDGAKKPHLNPHHPLAQHGLCPLSWGTIWLFCTWERMGSKLSLQHLKTLPWPCSPLSNFHFHCFTCWGAAILNVFLFLKPTIHACVYFHQLCK